MESTKNRKKGLLSIVALIVCLAMLTVGTFAWFTDTATVKGNKVMAGTLTVDVVAPVEEVLDAFAQDRYGKSFNGLGTEADDIDGSKTKKEVIQGMFNDQHLVICADKAEGGPTADFGSIFKGKEATYDTSGKLLPGGTGEDEVDSKMFVTLTGKIVPVMSVANVEPGSTYPVKMHVMNSGELAVSYAAGFSIDENASKTGLKVLEEQRTALGDKYNYLLNKLVPKQWAKNDDGTDKPYDSTKVGVEGYDLGGRLENVLEVYAMTKPEYDAALNPGSHAEAMPLLKDDRLASGTVPAHDANYIGTIAQIIHCNDTAYLAALDNRINAAEGDAKVKLEAEKTELGKVAKRLAKAASGYCVPESYVDNYPTGIPVYERNGSPRMVTDPENPTGPKIEQVEPAKNIGTTYFAIHMPGEEANDLYQNAMLTLNAGITANQVELEEDGIHVMVYDDATARTTTTD